MPRDDEFDLALLGFGMRGAGQLTFEQLRCLQAAVDVVYSSGVDPKLMQILESLGVPLHDVGRYYVEGPPGVRVYERMAETVLDLASRRGRTAFLQYGHPMVYSRPSRILVREAEARGLRLRVFAGISSLDEIFSVLRLDIRDRDLQVFHAEHLFKRERKLDPDVDVILVQPAALRDDPEAARRCQTYLERFFPREHEVLAIHVSPEGVATDELRRTTLGDLSATLAELHFGHTLFLRGLGADEG